MAFVCPACRENALNISAALELPPDDYNDEITLQAVACGRCTFRGVAVYEESRRGALDSEAADHTSFEVDGDTFTSLLQAIARCPTPSDKHCTCPTHVRFGRRDG